MKTSVRVFHWLPRILCILAIFFISIFAADAFAPGLTIWRQLEAFFMHLIPSFVLIAVLFISWKWEFTGGIIFIAIGLVMSPFLYMLNHNRNHFSVGISLMNVIILTFPFILTGILFLVSHYLKKKDLPAA